MLEILHSILQAYIFISVVFTTFFIIHVIKSIRKDLAEERGETTITSESNLYPVYLEKEGDVSYLYDGVTNKFIAQGTNNIELWSTVAGMFPGKDFIVKDANGNADIVYVQHIK